MSRDEAPDPSPDPETHAGDVEQRDLLSGLLRRIRPERAEALILHACDERPASAIAQALGVNENTVKSRIHRGCRDLRALLTQSRLGQGDARSSGSATGRLRRRSWGRSFEVLFGIKST